jgi:hypothetical protein
MLIKNVVSTNVTVERGFATTAASSHSQGDTATSIVYFKDLGIDLISTGFIGQTQTDVHANTYVIIVHEKSMDSDGFVIYGPVEFNANAIISIKDNVKDIEVDALVQQLNYVELTATFILMITKTKTIFADSVVI